MTVAQTLKDVKELLGPEGEHWTQEAYARGKSGRAVKTLGKAACQWCLVGAFNRVRTERNITLPVFSGVLRNTGMLDYSIVDFNDTHEWPEVSALLDKAIEEAERQGL